MDFSLFETQLKSFTELILQRILIVSRLSARTRLLNSFSEVEGRSMKIRALKELENAPGSSSATNKGLQFLRKKYNFALELRRQRESEEDGEKAAQRLSAKPIEGDSSLGTVEKRPICLGKITHRWPTVSHLLSRNPAYRKRCYELIHAAQNCAKPYKQIPLGQTIYLDPDREEILWGDKQLVQGTVQVSKCHSSGEDVMETKSAPQVDGKVRSPYAGAESNALLSRSGISIWIFP